MGLWGSLRGAVFRALRIRLVIPSPRGSVEGQRKGDNVTSDEQARAAQEGAKFGQKAVDASTQAGGFLARAFGEALEHFAEAVTDKLSGYRIVNRAEVAVRTRKKLERLGVVDYKCIELRTGIPFLEAISEEPDETIQDVWANYMANSLNADSSVVASRQLINVIKQLELADLRIMSAIPLDEIESSTEVFKIINATAFSEDELTLNYSLARLAALGLFSLVAGNDAERRPCRITIETSLGEFNALPFLMFLKRAIAEPADE